MDQDPTLLVTLVKSGSLLDVVESEDGTTWPRVEALKPGNVPPFPERAEVRVKQEQNLVVDGVT